jgi:hypothetical protein
VIALWTTDSFSRQRRRLRKENKVIVRRRKNSKINSGQGFQREARYPDELVDWLSAARGTPTPTITWSSNSWKFTVQYYINNRKVGGKTQIPKRLLQNTICELRGRLERKMWQTTTEQVYNAVQDSHDAKWAYPSCFCAWRVVCFHWFIYA